MRVLFVYAAVAEGGIYVSGLFIMAVLWGSTLYSLYSRFKWQNLVFPSSLLVVPYRLVCNSHLMHRMNSKLSVLKIKPRNIVDNIDNTEEQERLSVEGPPPTCR